MDSADFIPGSACGHANITFICGWRQQRLSLRNELAQLLTAIHLPEHNQELPEQLNSFCSNLLDYACAGHFVIYTALAGPAAGGQTESQRLQAKILRYIGDTTDQLLLCYEQIEMSEISRPDGTRLDQILVRLVRILLMRFALEEQLFELGGMDSRAGSTAS
jgi:regulator of sigma D